MLAGQKPGIKEADDGIWLASFMQYDPGYFDLEQKTLQPSTTRSARGCHPCLRYDLLPMSPGWILDKLLTGGESGIRTHGTVSRTHAFQACALSHSAISPDALS